MSPRRIDRSLRWVDASYNRPALRQSRGHKAASAAKIQYGKTAPIANDRVKKRKPRRNHIFQRSQPARLTVPPVRRDLIDREVVPFSGPARSRHPVRNLQRVGDECIPEPVPEAPFLLSLIHISEPTR